MSDRDIKKAMRHVNQNECLIFERSSPGKKGYRLPPLDVPEVDYKKALGKAAREDLGNMPEVSEMEIIRHFTRLSTWNYAIDLGMYPLGSCTMKYNPKINEQLARLEGFTMAHPYLPAELSQGALEVQKMLETCLAEISGMAAVTLQPMSDPVKSAYALACKTPAAAGGDHAALIAGAQATLKQEIAAGALKSDAVEVVYCPICGCRFTVTADSSF